MDGLVLALQEMNHARYANRTLLIVSDLKDSDSRHKSDELRRFFEQSPFPSFAVVPAERSGHQGHFVGEDEHLLAEAAFPDEETRDAVMGMLSVMRAPYVLEFATARPSLRGLDVETVGINPKPKLAYGSAFVVDAAQIH